VPIIGIKIKLGALEMTKASRTLKII